MIREKLRTAKNLWFTPDTRHFYLIDPQASIGDGPLELVSLGGGRRRGRAPLLLCPARPPNVPAFRF